MKHKKGKAPIIETKRVPAKVSLYNPWYTYTYQPILEIADWNDLSADVEKKIVAIFSWMPRTIMSINHEGKKFKSTIFAVQDVRKRIEGVSGDFNSIRNCDLMTFDIAEHEAALKSLCDALFESFGSVAASKYLHFSAPKLIPMWDSKIRKGRCLKDSSDGFIRYMKWFKEQLEDDRNYRKALEKCPDNPVRGWDIICMEGR